MPLKMPARPMELIFMLTRDDRTVPDAFDVLDAIRSLGLRHIGFKHRGGQR